MGRRRNEAKELTHRLFWSDDPVSMAITVLALAQLCNRHAPWSTGWVQRIQSNVQRGNSLHAALEREIRMELKGRQSDFIDDLKWRREPIEDLINAAKQQFDEMRATIDRDPVIEELREVLAVESGSNVVRLVNKS